jgi:hypothetical protein
MKKECRVFLTIRYKQGYIHYSYVDGHEVVRVSVDDWAYVVEVESERAAQLLITKHGKKGSLK